MYEDQFLFDLSNDESELTNLLNPEAPHHDAQLAKEVVSECEGLVADYIEGHELFSSPIDMLHSRLSKGDPSLTEDGKFVRPFLTAKEYKTLVVKMFKREGQAGNYHSDAQLDLYVNAWTVPQALDSPLWERVMYVEADGNEYVDKWWVVDAADVVAEDESTSSVPAQGILY